MFVTFDKPTGARKQIQFPKHCILFGTSEDGNGSVSQVVPNSSRVLNTIPRKAHLRHKFTKN